MRVDVDRLRTLEKICYGPRSGRFRYAPGKIILSECLRRAAKVVPFAVPVEASTFWGRTMKVYIPENVGTYIYRYGVFELELCSVLCQLVKPGSTFFDVGAHFGFFSLLASDLGAKVHCFEPTRSTFAVLSENLTASGATLNNFAAWSESGEIALNDFGMAHAAFNSAYRRNALAIAGRTYNVPAMTIDEYVDRTKSAPSFVKIDAENAEYEILSGMKDTMRSHRPIVSIEVGEYGGRWTSKQKIELAMSLGYTPMEYRDGGFHPHKVLDTYSYDNILLFPHKPA